MPSAWETLLYVYSYYASPLGDSISPQEGGRYSVYTTSFPYWIASRPNLKIISDSEDPLTSATDTYRDTISKFFNPSTVDVNLVDKFVNDKRDDMTKRNAVDRARWIRQHVQDVILTRFNLINNPRSTYLPSTSADESEYNSRVSSIFFMSDDENHVVEVDWINLNVFSMPSTRKRTRTPSPLPGGSPAKKP